MENIEENHKVESSHEASSTMGAWVSAHQLGAEESSPAEQLRDFFDEQDTVLNRSLLTATNKLTIEDDEDDSVEECIIDLTGDDDGVENISLNDSVMLIEPPISQLEQTINLSSDEESSPNVLILKHRDSVLLPRSRELRDLSVQLLDDESEHGASQQEESDVMSESTGDPKIKVTGSPDNQSIT